jgi:hypothetical protein
MVEELREELGGSVGAPSNRSFDTDAHRRAFASLRSFSLVAGQLRRYMAAGRGWYACAVRNGIAEWHSRSSFRAGSATVTFLGVEGWRAGESASSRSPAPDAAVSGDIEPTHSVPFDRLGTGRPCITRASRRAGIPMRPTTGMLRPRPMEEEIPPHNTSVDTDAQRRPLPPVAPVGRRSPLR